MGVKGQRRDKDGSNGMLRQSAVVLLCLLFNAVLSFCRHCALPMVHWPINRSFRSVTMRIALPSEVLLAVVGMESNVCLPKTSCWL